MIFDGDNSSMGQLGTFDDCFGIQRFDGERIHNPNVDAFTGQLICSF